MRPDGTTYPASEHRREGAVDVDVDPLEVLIDLCPFLASCSCGEMRKCLQFGYPGWVRKADCLACVGPKDAPDADTGI